VKDIDYLPDEMNYERSNLCWNEPATADAFNDGWRAACEAWHAKCGVWIKAIEARAEAAQAKAGPDLAAENLVLRAEVRAWRACPSHHFEKVWSQPQMSGRHRSEYRQAIADAMEATDAMDLRGIGHLQPAPDWRAACVVEKQGRFLAVKSPTGEYYLATPIRWVPAFAVTLEDPSWLFGSRLVSDAALAACTTPPPDWRQP
jgi:hypothetical protein